MSGSLLNEVKQFLDALEPTQQELSQLFHEKRTALTAARSDDLRRLCETEAELSKRLQVLLGRRQQILHVAKQADLPSQSLRTLVASIANDQQDVLVSRLERAREMAGQIRRESWIHWIIAHRTYSHYTELLNLIANCGEKAPIYGRKASDESTGGVFLDASI